MGEIVDIFEDVFFERKKIISHEKGDIYHCLKSSDSFFEGFGEAYFTKIKKGEVKGWKLHRKMQLNLFVMFGQVKFYISDRNRENVEELVLNSSSLYGRLCVAPNYWVAFEGIGDENIIVNIASVEHDPDEAINMDFDLR